MSFLPPHWARPELLWLTPLLLAATYLLWRRRRHASSWEQVIDPQLLPHLLDAPTQKKRSLLPLLFLVSSSLALLAAAGPAWNKLPQPVQQQADALVIVLDLSYSMMATDIQPSRIVRARQKISDLLNIRKEGQTALVAYAGDAHVVSPLTDDTPTIANLLPALSPGMMPVPGANALAGIEQAQTLLRSAGVTRGRILLLSDEVSAKQAKAINRALDSGQIQLSVIGVGTAQGAPIALPNGGFLKDSAGNIVVPKLDMAVLRQLAANNGGRYSTVQLSDSDIAFAAKPLPALPTDGETLLGERMADTWQDQGHWLIIALLPLILILFRRGYLILLLLPLMLIVDSAPTQAMTWQDFWQTRDQQGATAYQNGDTEKAATLFEQSNWRGTAAYDNGDYEDAAKAFSDSDDADAWYNRGNALARAGDLDGAIAAYEKSLALSPGQADAIANKKLVEELKQQQEQKQEKEQEQQQPSSEDQQQNNDEDQQKSQDSDNADEGDSQQQDQQQGQQQDQQEDQDQGEPQDDSDTRQDSQPAPSENEQDTQNNQQNSGSQDNAAKQQDQNDTQEDTKAQEAEQTDQQPEQTNEINAMANDEPLSEEEKERQQALQQWLRRVPDDPAGLLRNKFLYESRQRQRQQQHETNDDEKIW